MQRHSVLELKTKTTAIAAFKHVRHNRKTIISWSLNTPHVITSQERGTSSLRARIRAATQCQSWGYPLAFHFDPIVVYPGCEFDYEEVVEILFQSISADNIVWISLGSLRFIPSLQHIIKKRFPDSNIIYNEFITGTDAKMRYFKALRIRIYRHIFEKIKSYSSSTTVYLCMEDKQVWRNSFGYTPEDSAELSQLLDRSARSICDLE
jgi:spore photoproduct lyase